MADTCIFCGKALRRGWSLYTLTCGDVEQPVCGDCSEQYGGQPPARRARLALDTGRASEPERLRAFLARVEEQAEQARRRREYQKPVLTCCGQEMTALGTSEFQLGREALFLGSLSNLLAGAMELTVFRCERCGQVKFFDPAFFPKKAAQEEPETSVTRAAAEAQPDRAPKPRTARTGEKPPWER